MRQSLFFLLFLLSSVILLAQNHVIDSLRLVLKAEKEDTNKVNTLNALCSKLWRSGKYDSSMTCANFTLALAERLGYKNGSAKALNTIGIIYDDNGKYPQAIESYLKALALYRETGNKWGIAGALGNLGDVFYSQGNYSKALDYGLQGLAVAQEIGNKDDIAADYISIAVIYLDQGYYPKALEYDFKALSLCHEIGNKEGIATALGNIGNIYDQQNNYPKALEYGFKALDAYKEIEDKRGIALTLGNIGNVYDKESDHTKALDYHFKSLAIQQELGNQEGIANNFTNIGTIYQVQGNYPLSRQYLNKALVIFQKMGNLSGQVNNIIGIGFLNYKMKDYKLARNNLDSGLRLALRIGEKDAIVMAYSNLSALDSVTGNYKGSLENYKMSVIYNDSIENETNTKKTVQVEMNFEFEQKQAGEKAAQDKKDAIAAQEKKKQLVIRNSFMGGFVLMLALAFFIFRGYRQKQKANEIISNQKAVVEQKQKEILDSIHYAQRIQKALLASDSLLTKYLPEYFVLYKPKDIVSGDFYWGTLKNDRFYLAVCDSTGHGVPGAFMSLLNISFLNEAITEKNIMQPNEVFNHARKKLIENVSQDGGQDGMDGTLISLPIVNKNYGEMIYSVAYNAPLVIRNNSVIELNADKMPVGASPKENESFTNQSYILQKGDMVYAYTDGFADQFGGAKGKKFMHRKFVEKLATISNKPLAEQKDILNSEFEKWKGMLEQVDDVLVIGIKV